MGGLFGSQPSTSSFNLMTPGQSNLFTGMESILGENLGQGVPAYSGQLPGTQGAQPLQQQSFSNISDLLSGTGPLQQETYSGLKSLIQPWDQGQATDWWKTAVQAPAMQNWNQQIAPNIMQKFSGYDATNSGGARRALSESGANLQTGLASSMSNYLSQNKEQSAQDLMKAAGLSNTIQQGNIGLGLQGGQQQYNIAGQDLQAKYNEYLRTQAYNNPWLQYLMPILGMKTFEPVASGGQSSGIGGMLGGLGSILGAGGTSGLGAGLADLIF